MPWSTGEASTYIGNFLGRWSPIPASSSWGGYRHGHSWFEQLYLRQSYMAVVYYMRSTQLHRPILDSIYSKHRPCTVVKVILVLLEPDAPVRYLICLNHSSVVHAVVRLPRIRTGQATLAGAVKGLSSGIERLALVCVLQFFQWFAGLIHTDDDAALYLKY